MTRTSGSSLQHLLQLSEVDEKLVALAEQRVRSRVTALQERHKRLLERRLEAAEEEVRCGELASTGEERLAKLSLLLASRKGKLYSGAISSSKELESLQQEIAVAEQERAALEDEVLTAMETRESLERALWQLNLDIEVAGADLAEAMEDEVERQALLDSRQADLIRVRAEAAASIQPEILERYMRLRVAHSDPLAKVKGGQCGGCRMSVPDSHWRGVRQGQLLNCPTCGRFLHVQLV